MAKGNGIIITPHDYRGRQIEGKIAAAQTPVPGTIVQIQASSIPSTTAQGGVYTLELYDADVDGGRPKGPFIVLDYDKLQGRLNSTAYAAGERAFGYVPLPGDELNLLVKNLSGTADDHTKGEIAIVNDTTGKLIVTTGSPECEPAMIMETITDPTADTLAWYIWTGY